MASIITYLLLYNQYLLKQIHQLLLFIAKNIPLKPDKNNCQSPTYQKFIVDKLPLVKKPEKLDYKQLLKNYHKEHGKELKPIKSRGGSSVPTDNVCPHCGAPHNYLYSNDGGRRQFLCKVDRLQ